MAKYLLTYSFSQLKHLRNWNVIHPNVFDQHILDGTGYKYVVELFDFVWYIWKILMALQDWKHTAANKIVTQN